MADRSGSLVILGASGFVGRHLGRAAAAWATDVVVVTRGTASIGDGCRVVRGNILEPATLTRTLPSGSVIVNLAYDASAAPEANVAIADGVMTICRDTAAARLVHISTATVVGWSGARWITEETPCRPATVYQHTKLAVEARLRERTPVPLVVLRPTAVFGRGGLNLRKLVRDLQTRPAVENYVRACVSARRAMNLVPVETVVSAIAFAATSDRALADGLYLVAADDCPENNFADVERILRRTLGLSPYGMPPVAMPIQALTTLLRLRGRAALNPRARFSSDRIARAGGRLPVSFAESLVRYAEGCRSRGADSSWDDA